MFRKLVKLFSAPPRKKEYEVDEAVQLAAELTGREYKVLTAITNAEKWNKGKKGPWTGLYQYRTAFRTFVALQEKGLIYCSDGSDSRPTDCHSTEMGRKVQKIAEQFRKD